MTRRGIHLPDKRQVERGKCTRRELFLGEMQERPCPPVECMQCQVNMQFDALFSEC